MTTPQRSWQALTGDHGAGDAGLSELIAANVAGELENIADDLRLIHADVRFQRPESAALVSSCSQRAYKIAAGIREALDQPMEADLESFDCPGPDRCCDDLCRGNDYGVCGKPSDTEMCLSTGVHGPYCDLVHDDWDPDLDDDPEDSQ